ncbi:hypothetical protein K438DRAFT_1782898 [Mycena galopus ATCC 62051]|nr:hypothetical protein K438DRAFT_1782898 [Mycena galopus ATCC 62051]
MLNKCTKFHAIAGEVDQNCENYRNFGSHKKKYHKFSREVFPDGHDVPLGLPRNNQSGVPQIEGGVAESLVQYTRARWQTVSIWDEGDTNNGSRARRAQMQARVAKETGMMLTFVELICNDPLVLAANVALKVRSGNLDDDYIAEEATADFLRCIYEYEQVTGGYSRENQRLSMQSNHILSHELAPQTAQHIFLSGNYTTYNVEGKLGGDSLLLPRGLEYAKALPGLIEDHIRDQPLTVLLSFVNYLKFSELVKVWTSTLRRTIQTAEHLQYPKFSWKSLDELDAGVCTGMTYQEIAVNFCLLPRFGARRK